LIYCRIMTFYVQYPQRSNCANLRFGGKVCVLAHEVKQRQSLSSFPLQSG